MLFLNFSTEFASKGITVQSSPSISIVSLPHLCPPGWASFPVYGLLDEEGTLISKGCFLLWFTMSDHQSKNETKAALLLFISLVKVPLYEARVGSELLASASLVLGLKYAPPHWLSDYFWKTRKTWLFDNFLANFIVSVGQGESQDDYKDIFKVCCVTSKELLGSM